MELMADLAQGLQNTEFGKENPFEEATESEEKLPWRLFRKKFMV